MEQKILQFLFAHSRTMLSVGSCLRTCHRWTIFLFSIPIQKSGTQGSSLWQFYFIYLYSLDAQTSQLNRWDVCGVQVCLIKLLLGLIQSFSGSIFQICFPASVNQFSDISWQWYIFQFRCHRCTICKCPVKEFHNFLGIRWV